MKFLKTYKIFENNQESNEGVGDKYLQNNFHIPDEYTEFNKYYNMMNLIKNKENIVFKNDYTTIIKNPKTLKNIGDYARGIIDKEGNLYVEKEASIVHSVMLIYLNDIGILPNIDNLWHRKIPTDFITVQRLGYKNLFAMGESNETLVDDDDRYIPDIAKKSDTLPIFDKFIEKAKKKNPNINFTNKLINYEIFEKYKTPLFENNQEFKVGYKTPIFEKTSLINLNVPFVVMKQIQRDYSFSDNTKWEQIKYKKDFISTIKKDKNTLIISVGKNKIFIVFSYDNEYYIETYNQILNDDFGNVKWQRNDRFKASLDEIIKMIYTRGCKSYKLISGNWSHEFSNVRKIRKENSVFDDITYKFKQDFIKNYSKISKQLYGKSDIANDLIKANSLTNFEEDLINFEDEYSDKYKEYLNIPIMIDRWSRDKIMTALTIYLRTKKLINL